jgi:hypothetical protein
MMGWAMATSTANRSPFTVNRSPSTRESNVVGGRLSLTLSYGT